MTFNLIFKNVRRSMKDYAIYFLTLALGVSLFYAFNSISSQPDLNNLNYAMELFGDALVTYIGLLSKFIAVILAFLIVYANQFIMKRRKKEMGIYMSLGMNKWKISSLFVGETFLVGILALMVGLGIGFLLSQGISIVALKLFVGNAAGFQLMFSAAAMKQTILSFALIFIIVMLFNTRTIMNIKLVDLLTASRKNQELKVPNKAITLLLFLLSLVSLVTGITLLLFYGLDKDKLTWITGLLVVGVILFYYTVSGVIIMLMKTNKKTYFTGLNAFSFRQLGSKMQTNFLVMIVLCGLLFTSLVVLGTGFSTTSSMNKQAKASTPFDLTIMYPYQKNIAPLNRADRDGIKLRESLKSYAQTTLYKTTMTYEDLFKGQKLNLAKAEQKMLQSHINFISQTDFNKQMRLSGQKQIQLNPAQYIINANHEGTEKNVKYFLQHNGTLTVGHKTLTPVSDKQFKNIISLSNSTITNDMGTVIIPDQVARTLKPDSYLLNGKFPSIKVEGQVYEAMNNKWIEHSLNGSMFYVTNSVIKDRYFGTFGVIAFICSYLGIVLLIVTLSVLSLQQLTEIQDNKERYRTLAKIGADKGMINKSIFKQVAFYFVAPLIMAAILSSFTTRVVLDKLEPFFEISIAQNMIISYGVILALYAVYFVATYQSAKQIIVENNIK
ncbi:ABC transporter permease [Priestia megaterium]|uniref:ABC transporter permease n=1 Tax=Priestia megaterium TaxID=1404 RepID=UPI002B243333|nr:ABC transporter permease [Priestia megaterium]MEB2294588.1 ABC transporter permease [Priestia megaterium]